MTDVVVGSSALLGSDVLEEVTIDYGITTVNAVFLNRVRGATTLPARYGRAAHLSVFASIALINLSHTTHNVLLLDPHTLCENFEERLIRESKCVELLPKRLSVFLGLLCGINRRGSGLLRVGNLSLLPDVN